MWWKETSSLSLREKNRWRREVVCPCTKASSILLPHLDTLGTRRRVTRHAPYESSHDHKRHAEFAFYQTLPTRLVTSREYVSLQLQKQGGPCVLRLVKLSLKSGVIALCQKPVRNVRKEGLNLEGRIYREVSPRNRCKNRFQ